MASPHVVYKFGGTSVGSVERFRAVIDILQATAREGRPLAVVSAQGKVTRRLSAGLEAFATCPDDRQEVVNQLIEDLRGRHASHAKAVLRPGRQSGYVHLMEEHLQLLRRRFVQLERDGLTPARRDAILATGEQLSVPLVTLALRDAGCRAPHCDATALVVTDDTFGEARVQVEATRKRLQAWYASLPPDAVPVVAGFIGATPGGQTTTLGFEGSDYSASLFAALLGADCLTRYTDVDGLYTEDPHDSESAERFDCLSMEKALALTESGRLGMHSKTLRPLVNEGIPMQVRSIDTPAGDGTQIVPAGRKNVRLTPPVGTSVPQALP